MISLLTSAASHDEPRRNRSRRRPGVRVLWTVILAGLLAGLLAACGDERTAVRVSSNDFTEQRLLAEMMVLLAEDAGVRAERVPAYGDNSRNLQALKRGILDAYPEYTGTILALSGVPPWTSDTDNHERAESLVAPLGLAYLEPFGLNNSFSLAVRRDYAIAFGLETISDLSRVPGELRFAADAGFLERNVDGLYALARRYGLELGTVTVTPIAEREQLFRALADRTADVAEVFQTDAPLLNYGVQVLRDDLGFFARYEPAPLVRQEVLDRHPELRDAWGALSGLIDTQTMRELNGRVDQGGEDERFVAQRFLEAEGLLPESGATGARRGALRLAVSPLEDRGYLPIRAANAIRATQPARRLTVDAVDSPARAVREGRARFGLVGAEEFFSIEDDGTASLIPGLEAVGVVGNRLAHLFARPDAAAPARWRRIGTGPEGGTSWRLARFILRTMDLQEQVDLVPLSDFTAMESALERGAIDAIAVMVELRQAGLVNLLQNQSLVPVPIDAFRGDSPALRYPFLQPARIPAQTYPGQDVMLETISAQVVLATRLPPNRSRVGEAGPGFVPGVFTRLPQRLPFETARRLNEALGVSEAVSPLLPISPGLMPETPELRPVISSSPGSAILNVFALGFLIIMALLYFRRLPERPALTPGKPNDEN